MVRTWLLLRRVRRRKHFASVGRRLHLLTLIFALAYALTLCAARLLGLFTYTFPLASLFIPPGLALLAAAILSRPPTMTTVARYVDARMKTRDLFLTAVELNHSLGDYQPLVALQAEEQAAKILPAQIAPFHWLRGARNVVLAVAILAVGLLALPQLDPFGREKERAKQVARRKLVEEGRKAVALRVEILRNKDNDADLTKEVAKELTDLKGAFDAAKPKELKANLEALTREQKDLAQLWRKCSEEKLKDALDRAATQQFGAASPEQQEWKRQLSKGETVGMKQELNRLAELAKKIASMPEGLEKERVREQLAEGLKKMAEFAQNQANNQPLNAALARAMEQLASAGNKLDADALKALGESLQLSELELEAMAQNIRDLVAIEEGLKALQLAKRLNAQGELDGEASGECKGIGDYAALYAKLMGGRGMGQGMQGPGTGEGGKAPEEPDAETAFKNEQSKTQLLAGKTLLELKIKGISDPGAAREAYAEQIAAVKQNASEAIVQEHVPPGYHRAISQYFDTLEKDSGRAAAAK